MERVVAGYRLERRLGKGAMGEVWLGRHEETGGVGAVKLLRDRKLADLFARERRAVARLSHPHVVGLYDLGPDYLVTAYVHGPDLQKRMRAPLAPGRALRITRQIASALEHAHDSGVVHRDVKPSNILLDEEENAYLADFGVARLTDDPVEDVGAGTPAFMAPEQASGELATAASDQYALARTLLALLVGDRLPQNASVALSLLPKTLPQELHAILWRATSSDPRDRYPNMRAFAAALGTVDLGESAAAPALLAVRREPFAWAARALDKKLVGVDLQRADYRLSALMDVSDFRRETGYADLGWAMWGRAERLGELTHPEALARASEIVVLLHGYFASRDSWDGVAQSICRDNGHTVVLVPDLHGFGESRFHGVPTLEQASPANALATVQAWLRRLGLSEVPTVLVGHSAGAAAILSATDEKLGPNVHRVAVTPVFPFADRKQRRMLGVIASTMKMLSLSAWLYGKFANAMLNSAEYRARYSEAERKRQVQVIREMGAPTLERIVRSCIAAQPAEGDHLERCLIVVTPDDPLLPEATVLRALELLGFPAEKVYRLASGGHFPHGLDDSHPEWTNRNIDDMVGIIDAVLDLTRQHTTGAGMTRSTLPARGLTRTQVLA